MPHFHLETSANLEDVVDMDAVCEAIALNLKFIS